MSEVESLEGHYFDLKSKLSTGALTPEEFRHQVARLWFEDADGQTWMIGAHTGHWYVYRNDLWTLADPPREHAPEEVIACPRCGESIDAQAAFCGHCGLLLDHHQEPHPAIRVAQTTPPAARQQSPAQPVRSATTAPVSPAGASVPYNPGPKVAPAGSNGALPLHPAPAAARRMPSRLMMAASGALLFGLLFLCLASLGGFILLRNNNSPTTVALVSTATATPRHTVTPTARPVATAIVGTIAGSTLTVVPTPIVVFIVTSTPTPGQAIALATAPSPASAATGTATATAIVTDSTATPTATIAATAAASPTDTATPGDTDTPAPTNTPRPPTNTPVPRPPTATPVPAAVVKGHIAYPVFNALYTDKPGYDTYIQAVDGSGRALIAPRRRQPQIAANGSLLLNMGIEPNHEKLWIRDLASGAERPIENTPIEAMDPSWSPDGNSVLYSSTEMDDRQSRLFIVDARGASDHREWLKFGSIDLIGRYPTWINNGQIVYSGCDKWGGTGQCGIVRVNPDGQAPAMLTNNERDGVDVAPSGRGGTVVFMSRRDGNWEVYSVPLGGGPAKNLTNSPGEDGLPTLSPDGQSVAFVSNRSGQWAVWTMKLDGSGQKMLFNTEGGFATGDTLDWSNERISWGP